MYNHAPENYICPICLGIHKLETENTLIRPNDIVYQDDLVTAFIGSIWVGNNPGHPLVVPNEHFENVYDMPLEVGHRIFDVAQKIANALKIVRECDGITFVQNNEPVGGQHAFHYHMHIFPRFENDELHANMNNSRRPVLEERAPYSQALKKELHNL